MRPAKSTYIKIVCVRGPLWKNVHARLKSLTTADFFPLIVKQYEGMLRGLTITEGHPDGHAVLFSSHSPAPMSLDLHCIPKSFRFMHLVAGMLTDPRSELVWSGTFFSLCKPNSGSFCLQQFSILEWADKHFNGMVKMQGPGGRRGPEWRVMNGQWGRLSCWTASWPGRSASICRKL